jgi:hypothetical protein
MTHLPLFIARGHSGGELAGVGWLIILIALFYGIGWLVTWPSRILEERQRDRWRAHGKATGRRLQFWEFKRLERIEGKKHY